MKVTVELEPADPRDAPVLQAIGQVVAASWAIEALLIGNIMFALIRRDGMDQFTPSIMEGLQGDTAGTLVKKLRKLDIDSVAGERWQAVVKERNHVVHNLRTDETFIAELLNDGPMTATIEMLNATAKRCGDMVCELATRVAAETLSVLGISLERFVDEFAQRDVQKNDDGTAANVVALAIKLQQANASEVLSRFDAAAGS